VAIAEYTQKQHNSCLASPDKENSLKLQQKAPLTHQLASSLPSVITLAASPSRA